MLALFVYLLMICCVVCCCFLFQAEDGIRDLVRSRGLGDVYKRQAPGAGFPMPSARPEVTPSPAILTFFLLSTGCSMNCLLYTSDAADERSSVDLGGRRIIKKKNMHRDGRYTCRRSKLLRCS